MKIDHHGNTQLHNLIISCTSESKLENLKEQMKNTIIRDNINIQNKYSNTPLHLATNNLNTSLSKKIIELLIKNGANPFIPNNKGEMVGKLPMYKKFIDDMFFIRHNISKNKFSKTLVNI